MGIDPVTHKPFSHLMAEIATTLAPPQVAHLAEAALGCFKDEMLHLLTKKRIDLSSTSSVACGGFSAPLPPLTASAHPGEACPGGYYYDREETIQKIKMGLSRAIMHEPGPERGWAPMAMDHANAEAPHERGAALVCDMYPAVMDQRYQYGDPLPYGNEGEGSAWSTCTGGAAGVGGIVEQHGAGSGGPHLNGEDDGESGGGKTSSKGDAGVFGSDCVLWDLSSDDLMNPIV